MRGATMKVAILADVSLAHLHEPSSLPLDVIKPCRVGSVGSVSASRTVGREFASRPGHTKDHHKNGTNFLPA